MRYTILVGVIVLACCATVAAGAQSAAQPALVAVPLDWLDEHTRFSTYTTFVSMLGGVAAFAISTWFVVMQMRDTQRWNIRKTSEEMLTSVITGDFPRLMDRLVLEFNWDILSHTNYDAIVARVTPAQLAEIDVTLRNVLRHLEVVCINMKNRIIDEEICFDYLRSILTTFYINCDTFIAKERDRRKEEHIFTNTERYARKWMRLIAMERKNIPYAKLRKEFVRAE